MWKTAKTCSYATNCLPLSRLWIRDCWPLSSGSKHYNLDSVLQNDISHAGSACSPNSAPMLFGFGHDDPAVPFPSPTTTLKLPSTPNQLSMSRHNQQVGEQQEEFNLSGLSDLSSEESGHEGNAHKRRAPGLTKLSGTHLPLIGTPTAPN